MVIPQHSYMILVLEISQPGRWYCELRMYYLSCKYNILLLFIFKMPQSCQSMNRVFFYIYILCYFRVVTACLVCAELFFNSSVCILDNYDRCAFKEKYIIFSFIEKQHILLLYSTVLYCIMLHEIQYTEANAIVDL